MTEDLDTAIGCKLPLQKLSMISVHMFIADVVIGVFITRCDKLINCFIDRVIALG